MLKLINSGFVAEWPGSPSITGDWTVTSGISQPTTVDTTLTVDGDVNVTGTFWKRYLDRRSIFRFIDRKRGWNHCRK